MQPTCSLYEKFFLFERTPLGKTLPDDLIWTIGKMVFDQIEVEHQEYETINKIQDELKHPLGRPLLTIETNSSRGINKIKQLITKIDESFTLLELIKSLNLHQKTEGNILGYTWLETANGKLQFGDTKPTSGVSTGNIEFKFSDGSSSWDGLMILNAGLNLDLTNPLSYI